MGLFFCCIGSLACRCKITSLSDVEFLIGKHASNFNTGGEKTICYVLRWWTVWSDFETLQISWNLRLALIPFLTSPSSSQCVGCHRQLGGTETGVQVRIRNRKPHCDYCYFQLKCEYWALEDWLNDWPQNKKIASQFVYEKSNSIYVNKQDYCYFSFCWGKSNHNLSWHCHHESKTQFSAFPFSHFLQQVTNRLCSRYQSKLCKMV